MTEEKAAVSEQDSRQASTLQRPTTSDPEAWNAYWKALGQPWRTQPEIDAKRQEYLANRRLLPPNIEQGIYPFKDSEPKLIRADVEWLLATHENGRGPVVWDEEKDKPENERRTGLDLRGADLSNVNLAYLPLTCLRGALDMKK